MKRNKKGRLLILQNILLSEPHTELLLDEDDIWDRIYEYVEQLPQDMQKLFKLYYEDMITLKDLGIRYGMTHSGIRGQLVSIVEQLKELCYGEKDANTIQ